MTRSIPAIEGLEARVLLSGTPIVVDTFNDITNANDGYTSLREAITQAAVDAGDDVIHLQAGTYALTEGQLTIADTTGQLSILSLDGLATLDAQNASRVMEVAYGSDVVLEQLSVQHGIVSTGMGGGVGNYGQLEIRNSSLLNNSVLDGYGGGIYNDTGAVLRIVGCSIKSNVTINGGGGMYNNGQVEIADSTFTQNMPAAATAAAYTTPALP